MHAKNIETVKKVIKLLFYVRLTINFRLVDFTSAREQPLRICKNKNKSNINCESAIGQHLIANPECAKPYTDDNLLIEVFWNLFTSRLKTQPCVDKKSLSSHWDSLSKLC